MRMDRQWTSRITSEMGPTTRPSLPNSAGHSSRSRSPPTRSSTSQLPNSSPPTPSPHSLSPFHGRLPPSHGRRKLARCKLDVPIANASQFFKDGMFPEGSHRAAAPSGSIGISGMFEVHPIVPGRPQALLIRTHRILPQRTSTVLSIVSSSLNLVLGILRFQKLNREWLRTVISLVQRHKSGTNQCSRSHCCQ